MLNVTERAKKHLKELLLAHTNDSEIGLRLAVGLNLEQIEILLDKERPNDQVVKHKGSKVLLVEQEVVQRIAGATMDTKDTPNGTEIFISKEAPES